METAEGGGCVTSASESNYRSLRNRMTTIRADAVSAAQACCAWLVWSGGWKVNQWTKRTGSGVFKAQDMSKRDRGVAIFSWDLRF